MNNPETKASETKYLTPKVKRVLLLCDFFSSLGGTERYNAMLAQGLQENDVDVRVYIGEKTRLHHWTQLLKDKGIYYKEPLVYHEDLNSDDIERQFIQANVAEINEWRPDVIHTHPFKKMAISWIANPLSDKTIPIVATEWTVPSIQSAHWFDPKTKDYIQKVSTYIATCKAIESGLRDYHDYAGNIAHIPHLVQRPNPTHTHLPKSDIFSVGCVSRLSVEKGLDFLIGAWRKIHALYPNATLHIYGHGTEKEHLNTLKNSLGLDGSVILEGIFDPHVGIDLVAKKHQIFVQPSLFESIPNSIIELMLRGRTIIATDVGGVRELVTEKTGILIEPGSTDEISDALIALFKSTRKTAQLGKAAAEFSADLYDNERNMAKIVSLYDSIIGNPKR